MVEFFAQNNESFCCLLSFFFILHIHFQAANSSSVCFVLEFHKQREKENTRNHPTETNFVQSNHIIKANQLYINENFMCCVTNSCSN